MKDQVKTGNIDKAMLEFFGLKRRLKKKKETFVASIQAFCALFISYLVHRDKSVLEPRCLSSNRVFLFLQREVTRSIAILPLAGMLVRDMFLPPSPHPTPCSAFRQVVLSVRRYPLNSKMKRGTMRIKSLAQEQRKRLKNIQSFKTHELSSQAIKSLVLPSRRLSGLETLSKPRRRRQRGRSKTKNIMSRTIAMECRVRETEAYGRERIMSVAVNHAVSSN